MDEDLDTLRATRDALETALAYGLSADLGHLGVLKSLSDECRARGGPGEVDSLSRLVFRWRQLQTNREALVAQVRRGPVAPVESEQEAG
jgi:hypothetical protein